METFSNYYIKDKNEPDKIIIVTDQDPKGVTITIKNMGGNECQEHFSLPRLQMIESLEYIVAKLKTTVRQEKI